MPWTMKLDQVPVLRYRGSCVVNVSLFRYIREQRIITLYVKLSQMSPLSSRKVQTFSLGWDAA